MRRYVMILTIGELQNFVAGARFQVNSVREKSGSGTEHCGAPRGR